MTRDELRNHCEKTCNRYRSAYIIGNFDKVDKTYEEHKLVLKLLDQEESVVKALEDVKAEIKNIPMTEERDWATYWDCRDDVLEIIDRKVNEVKGD